MAVKAGAPDSGHDAVSASPDKSDMPPVVRRLAAVSMCGMMAYMSFSAVIGLIGRRLGLSEVLMGVVLTVAGFAWMMTSQWWGRRSDRLGRQQVLLAGLKGSLVAYALLAIFVAAVLVWPVSATISFLALLILRTWSATYYGAVPVSMQAAVADVTTPQNRGRGASLLGTGTALGMVLGPAVASALSAIHLTLPLFGSALAVLVAYGLARNLDIPARNVGSAAQRPKSDVGVTDPRLRFALMLGLIAMLCMVSTHVTSGFFAQDRFGLSTQNAAALAGIGIATIGTALTCAQSIVRATGWPPLRLAQVGTPFAAVGFASAYLYTHPGHMLIGYFIAGFGMGFIFPAFQAGASLAVKPHEQGAAFGALNAVQALGVTIAPVLSTTLFRTFGPSAPFLLAGCLMSAAFLWSLQARAAPPQDA